MKNEINEEWKFEPDPTTRSRIYYLDKSPIKFGVLKYQLIYLNEIEKKRKLTDAEKADKRNLEILKKW